MEDLAMSYKEVFEDLPYRNLVMMQRDKRRETTGDIIKQSSSRELFGNKIKG